jgi:hypothetical protein
LGVSAIFAVLAGGLACLPAGLAGDWRVEDVGAVGGPRYVCGLGLDAESRVTWSLCRRRLLPVLDFSISGGFSLDAATNRIVGRVDDGYDDYRILASVACSGGEALISGEVRPDFDPDNVVPFTGRVMTADEVRRMEKDFRDKAAEAGKSTERAVVD